MAALTLAALLGWSHTLSAQLESLEDACEQQPMPTQGWAMHMQGNLEHFLDVNELEPEAARKLQELSNGSLRTSLTIQQRFEAGEIDCFQRLAQLQRMLEAHESQAAGLLNPEQREDYLDVVCPTGRRGCLAYKTRGVELVELLER